VSQSLASPPSTWLAVLPPGVSPAQLSELRSALEGRGWRADASRSDEQCVLAVEGPAGAEELAALLPASLEADLVPLLSAEAYGHQRLRRRFLSNLVGGLGLLTVLGLCVPLAAFLQPPEKSALDPDLVRVGARGELAVGGARRLRFHDQPVWVMHPTPERWLAVSATCTYLDGCLLGWDAERGQLVCPCHGCVFDPHGSVEHPPASIPLLRLDVLERGGELYLRSLL